MQTSLQEEFTMKKTAVLLLLAAIYVFAAACAPKESAPDVTIPEWTITIETPGGEKQFTSKDAAKLTIITVEATTTNKNGESQTNTYVGVKLADILSAVGVSDFAGVTVVAIDDYAADYDRALALADDTVLAWQKDGELITTEPPLQMAPAQGRGNQFVKFAAKIIVNP